MLVQQPRMEWSLHFQPIQREEPTSPTPLLIASNVTTVADGARDRGPAA
jgi:hypothetical protein